MVCGFWKQLNKENFVIIELDYEYNFNPIFIDINDFQFLMPPIMLFGPYTKTSIDRILGSITQGQITVSEFPGDVMLEPGVYYGKNVPLFRRNGYRESGAGIPHLIDCYLRVYSLNAGSNPYTSLMDL